MLCWGYVATEVGIALGELAFKDPRLAVREMSYV
jgi:hypothetical protein